MNTQQQKLRKILAASGWTKEQLANRMEVSRSTISSWLDGTHDPRDQYKNQISAMANMILGYDNIDQELLSSLKSRAERKKYSLRHLMNDRTLMMYISVNLVYQSSAIEGNSLSMREVSALLGQNQVFSTRPGLDQHEIVNYSSALNFLLDEMATQSEEFLFTPDLIQATHLRLMSGLAYDAGLWRRADNDTSGGRFFFMSFTQIPREIKNWCNFVNSETEDRIGLMAQSHADFESIHPFTDGNGRLGRLLLFALALKLGLVPPVIPRERRAAYLKSLQQAQLEAYTDPLEQLLAEAIIDLADKIDYHLE